MSLHSEAGPPRPTTFRQIVRATGQLDWSQFEGMAASRCAAGVALVLAAGLAIGEPSVSAFGAIGAVSVGFGSFQGTYRSRAAVMVYAALGMCVAIFIGSLAGHSAAAGVVSATLAAFLGGLFVALGPAASFVGLQCVVAVIIAAGFHQVCRTPAHAPQSSWPAACCRRCWS